MANSQEVCDPLLIGRLLQQRHLKSDAGTVAVPNVTISLFNPVYISRNICVDILHGILFISRYELFVWF